MEKGESKMIMITGCNKGVGYGVLKMLALLKSGHRFIMAIRTLSNGQKALETLEKEVPGITSRVIVQELDVTKTESINRFVEWLKHQPFKVDCLLNNAGVSYQTVGITVESIEGTFQTNLYGTIELTEKMLPLMPDSSKVVFVASGLGRFVGIDEPTTQKRLESPTLTKEQIFAIAKEYYEAVKAHPDQVQHVPFAAAMYPVYRYSKLLLNLYTRILGADAEILKRNIQVYSCCPGWVRTELGGPSAPLSIDQGAVCPSYVVELPYKVQPEFQGKFFSQRVVTPL